MLPIMFVIRLVVLPVILAVAIAAGILLSLVATVFWLLAGWGQKVTITFPEFR